MYRVINFFSGKVISTHATKQEAHDWTVNQGYSFTYKDHYLLNGYEEKPDLNSKPIILIIKETEKND